MVGFGGGGGVVVVGGGGVGVWGVVSVLLVARLL